MAGTILVKPSELRNRAQQLRSCAQSILCAVECVDQQLIPLNSDQFSGVSANRLRCRYQSRREILLAFDDKIIAFANQLDEAATAFEKADQSDPLSGTPRLNLPADTPSALARIQPDIIRASNSVATPGLIAAILLDETDKRDIWDGIQDTIARMLVDHEGKLERVEISLLDLVLSQIKEGSGNESVEKISFGRAQMTVETLNDLVLKGYIDAPEGWAGDKLDTSLKMLLDERQAPYLVSARLTAIADEWKNSGYDISDRPDILATLYSMEYKAPHADPGPSERGSLIRDKAVMIDGI